MLLEQIDMYLVFAFLILTFLALIQTTLLPLNFALAALVFYDLFIEEISNWVWVLIVSVLVSIFGNFNLGIVIVAFTICFLIIDLTNKFLPNNRLTKILLILLTFPLSEVGLILMRRVFNG